MRPLFFTTCLMLAALLLTGCSKPWSHQDSGNKQQSAAQFERDSVACEVLSGEKYPLDKHKQLELYEKCMNDKGWVRKRAGDGIRFDTDKKK